MICYFRFGKAADGFMRFGRAPSNDNANFIRFGRGGPDTNFMRFGRQSNGEDVKPAPAVLNVPMVRLGRPSGGLDNNNFMRFGRGKKIILLNSIIQNIDLFRKFFLDAKWVLLSIIIFSEGDVQKYFVF